MVVAGVVFDMDDTLYLERDYVKSGFHAVARHVSSVVSEQAFFQAMWSMFEAGVRGDTFNRALEQFPDVAEKYDIGQLVEVYRVHRPDIAIIPEIAKLLVRLRDAGMKLGVLSDGPLVSQQAKADALGVSALVDEVMLTDALGRASWKPSPAGFQKLAESLRVSHDSLVYVGDNPEKDFIAPNALGWQTIRLRMEGQLRCDQEPVDAQASPGLEVESVLGLSEIFFLG